MTDPVRLSEPLPLDLDAGQLDARQNSLNPALVNRELLIEPEFGRALAVLLGEDQEAAR